MKPALPLGKTHDRCDEPQSSATYLCGILVTPWPGWKRSKRQLPARRGERSCLLYTSPSPRD
eukprot:3322920-Alexandrium_andersonii.AAC.1